MNDFDMADEYYKKGSGYEFADMPKEAADAYEKAYELLPENEEILQRYANCLMRLHATDAAWKMIQKCISIGEANGKVSPLTYKYAGMLSHKLARAYETSDKPDDLETSLDFYNKSIGYYKKICEIDSMEADLYKVEARKKIAECYLSTKRYREAMDTLKKLEYRDMYEGLSNWHWKTGRYAEAEDVLMQENFDSFKPSDREQYNKICRHLPEFCQEKTMNQERAILYARTAQRFTSSSIARFELSITKIMSCFIIGDLKRAQRYANEANGILEKELKMSIDEFLSVPSFKPKFYGEIGWMLAGLGRFEDAGKYFEKMEDMPTCTNCDYHGCYKSVLYRGLLAIAMGKDNEALNLLKGSLIYYPDNVFAKNLIKRINQKKA